MKKDKVHYDIDGLKWWHTIEFPNGQISKGQQKYDSNNKASRFLMPDDLTGKTVLDFGCWDGYWAIRAKKNGASNVVATDRWNPCLKTAEVALGAYNIPYVHSGDLDEPINHFCDPEFDVVLFYGILYHLKNPFMGLWNAKRCCKPGGIVIIETAIDQGPIGSIKADTPLLWLADKPYNKDPSNHCVPNEPGVHQIMKHMGFSVLKRDRTLRIRLTLVCRKDN
jgi:tRNA (mo5U34)-methyltransferase